MRKATVLVILAVMVAPGGLGQPEDQGTGEVTQDSNSTGKGVIGSAVENIFSGIYSFLVEFAADVVEEVMARDS